MITVNIKNTEKRTDFKGNILSLRFTVVILDDNGDNYSYEYTLRQDELNLDIDEIIKRETTKALQEAYKFFQNPPVNTKDVIGKDIILEAYKIEHDSNLDITIKK